MRVFAGTISAFLSCLLLSPLYDLTRLQRWTGDSLRGGSSRG